MKLMKLTEDALMDYVDGRLDADTERQIERAIERDPSIGARVATLAEARKHAQAPPGAALDRTQLEARVRAFASENAAPARRRREWLPTLVAIAAAALVVGVYLLAAGPLELSR